METVSHSRTFTQVFKVIIFSKGLIPLTLLTKMRITFHSYSQFSIKVHYTASNCATFTNSARSTCFCLLLSTNTGVETETHTSSYCPSSGFLTDISFDCNSCHIYLKFNLHEFLSYSSC